MKPLSVQALERIGKNWDFGKSTRNGHLQHIKGFANFVSKRFALEDIRNLKPNHVQAYVQDMKEKQLNNGTICNRMTAVRDLAKVIGKANIVDRDNKNYGVARGSRQKPVIANQVEINRIRQALVERANSGDRVAMMCHAAAELRDAFGLRAKESLMSSKLVETAHGVALRIEGAKGGRVRDLRISNDKQLRAVQLVAQVSQALGSVTGRIIPPELNLEKAYNAQRTLWRELGGSKSTASHMHAARHATAQEMHTAGYSTGEIMAWLGHGEDRSPFCYIPK
ncbi:MAG: integrase domain-containing protein [Desulfuromonadaceae bacterium]|nr:integrase domain-containing protein [Desulfuromonadaceae bacterium]